MRTDQLFWSSRLQSMLGLAPDGTRVDFAFFIDRLHPDDRAAVMACRQRHLEGSADYDVECRLRKEDGSYIWVQNRGQAVWDALARRGAWRGRWSTSPSARCRSSSSRTMRASSSAAIRSWISSPTSPRTT
ncbi:MAG: PAS domain-containing protein [Rhizobiales bacterium]|nr:PAS domain-containing protein [Hyphomicrobiales bacterium]